MTEIHKGFQDVDQAAEASAFLAFLDAANALESIRSYRQRMLDLCPPEPGDRILDIGCGLGHSATNFAGKVGPTGLVVGVDRSDALIAEAKRRAEGLATPPRYQIGDAKQLAFEDGQFDQCCVERVLMYVDEPERALDEMLRVLRPKGRFALFEFDYDCIVVDARDQDLTQRIVRVVSASIPSPRIGRQLPRLLRERRAEGLTIIPHMVATPLAMFKKVIAGTVNEAVERGEFEPSTVTQWWMELEQSESAGQFFAGFHGFVVCGNRA